MFIIQQIDCYEEIKNNCHLKISLFRNTYLIMWQLHTAGVHEAVLHFCRDVKLASLSLAYLCVCTRLHQRERDQQVMELILPLCSHEAPLAALCAILVSSM